MAFRIGDKVFVHADARVHLTPQEGANAGVPFLVRSAKSLKSDNGAKVIVLKGTSIVPVTVAVAEAEPSFTIGLDVMQVSVDYLEHCGNGAQRMLHNGQIVFVRKGLAPVTFELEDMGLEKAFGLSSDSGGAPGDEWSGKMRRLLIKYKGKGYDPFADPSGNGINVG